MKFGLGQSATRVEDERFLTGKGRYSDDINQPAQTYACVVRSPHACANVLSVDKREALSCHGVLAVLTGDDAASDGIGALPCALPMQLDDGSPAEVPPHPILNGERVRHVGDCVVLVIAESLALAHAAAELVVVEYEELPATTSADEALAGGPTVWSHAPDNVAFVHRTGDVAAVAAAFSRAAHISVTEVPVSRVAMCPMEPRAALGVYHAGEDRFTLYSGSQNPHEMRAQIASMLSISEQQLRVVSPDMGGGFGMRGSLFPELVLVLWGARKIGRPVKWLGVRSEAFLADDQGRDVAMTVELALDEQANFLAVRLTSIANMGAYLSLYGTVHAWVNLGGMAGPYRTPAICAHVTAAYTHTTPIAPYRGAGRPEAALAIEQVVDQAALDLNIDRIELRRRNLIHSIEMPFQTGLHYCYDSGEFEQNIDRVVQLIDYEDFEPRRIAAAHDGHLLGLGIVYTVEQSAGPSDEGAVIRFAADGSATVVTGLHSHGQGHETIFRQVVSDTLGLDFEKVRYVQGDTDQIVMGGGTGGSRSGGVGSGALLRASEKIIDKGRRIAAHLLEVAEADLEFTEGDFVIAGTDRRMPLQDVASAAFNAQMRPANLDAGLTAFASFSHSAPTFPNGCHACEVEIDPQTGSLNIHRYVVVKDVGKVMNPMLLEGQLQGGIVQGYGQYVLEAVVWDDTGQPMTGSFMDYALPRASDVPFCEVETNEVLTATNPFGIKGAGESGTVGGLACVAAAVDNALTSAGASKIGMPATPERIWRALCAAVA